MLLKKFLRFGFVNSWKFCAVKAVNFRDVWETRPCVFSPLLLYICECEFVFTQIVTCSRLISRHVLERCM